MIQLATAHLNRHSMSTIHPSMSFIRRHLKSIAMLLFVFLAGALSVQDAHGQTTPNTGWTVQSTMLDYFNPTAIYSTQNPLYTVAEPTALFNGTRVQSYSSDIFENIDYRADNPEQVDIKQFDLGYDSDFFYFRISFVGDPDVTSANKYYVELDVNAFSGGSVWPDFFIMYEGQSGDKGTTWQARGNSKIKIFSGTANSTTGKVEYSNSITIASNDAYARVNQATRSVEIAVRRATLGSNATNASNVSRGRAWASQSSSLANTLPWNQWFSSSDLDGKRFDNTNNSNTASWPQVGPGAAVKLSITTQPSASASSGVAFAQQPVIQLRNEANNPVSREGVVVTANIKSGGGTLGGTTTATTNANGVATFTNLFITGTAGDRLLEFTSPNLTSVTSTAVALSGPATQLAFVAQPQNAVIGESTGTITVEILDVSGNRVTNNTSSVTLSIANNAGSGTLSGTVTANAVNGLATFTGLSLDKVGTGYTLTASATGLTSATSSAFNITAKTVTITGAFTAENKVYDGNNTATIDGSGLSISGLVSGSTTVSLNLAAVFSQTSVGENLTVSLTGTAKSLAITGTLPAGTEVLYTDNSRTGVGSQSVTATPVGQSELTPATKMIHFLVAELTTLSLSAGQGQQQRVSELLSEQLSVSLRDQFNNPVPNRSITFTLTGIPVGAEGMEMVAANLSKGVPAPEGIEVTVTTDANGNAGVLFKLGSRAGDYTIKATTSGLDPIEFTVVGLPITYVLYQNYPNPFNPSTNILFDLPLDSEVKLVIYDMLGRRVAVLAEGVYSAGLHSVEWSTAGLTLASGVYVYQLEAKGVVDGNLYVRSRKLTIMK
jgi:hypothetical protein